MSIFKLDSYSGLCLYLVFIFLLKFKCLNILKIKNKANFKSASFQFIGLLSLIIFMLIPSGCSTKKNTSMSRAYHNLTARYNVYFNGNESMKAGMRQVKKNYKDDYTKILPVFRYEDKAVSTMISSEMDLTIKKCAKTIKTHSITAKPKVDKKSKSKVDKEFLSKQEYCKMIDDAYLLMGKAHFYKREFETALQTFLLIVNKYKNENSVDEANLYIAKTYAETGDFKNAENTLLELKKTKRFDKKFMLETDLVYASEYLKQKDFDNAALKLNSVIKNERSKKERARYTFILAQIYQTSNKNILAADNYKKVIKMNPDYDMTFAANIHLAEISEMSGTSSAELKKQLKKMAKDIKNVDYLDQLYYALGKIELNENNSQEALQYFELSARSKSSNKTQKVKTYYALADMYYQSKNFKLAEAYFDSTTISIDKSYPDYQVVNTQVLNLKNLTHHLNVIDKEDSLQFLARMPENDRNKIIDGIIQKIAEEEQKQIEAKNNAQMDPNLMDYNEINRTANPMEGGKYYFYNPQTISIGQTDFKRKWGDRKLEDNWRRSNKQSIVEAPDLNTKVDSAGTKKEIDKSKITNKKSREFYQQDIPLTPDKLAASEKKIETAMFKSAEIYSKQLNENTNAENQFQKLLIRFPKSEYRLETLRNLYTLYNKDLNYGQAERCKQQIIREFPDSPLAKSLNDPAYADKLRSQELEIENQYQSAFKSYKNKDFAKAIELCEDADKKFPDNDLQSNFIYLKAISYGENGNKAKLKENLQLIVTKYPQSESYQSATSTLEVMNSKKFEEDIYKLNKDTVHYYVLVYPKNKIDINKLKFNFISLNADKYTQDDLKISIQALDTERDIILIQSFKNANSAIKYYQSVLSNNVMENIQKINPVHFVISAGNYENYLKNKQDLKYLNFFDKNYLIN